MDLLHHLDLPNVSDSSDTDDFLQELAALNDVGLLRATMESLECGRLTPLIKEELRCRIQSRRLSEGKEELLVEFPSPTPSQPRPDEVEKRDRRREQNRRAAQKFRKKKKERGEHLIEETQRLECHNTTLRSEIKQLHEEREQLTRIIQSHASICPLTPRQSPLTIPRESPLPTSIRESPLPLPTFSGNILAKSPVLGKSPVMGKSPVLVQSPAILVPPTRESPVPLLIINPTRESPIPSSLIPSSPVPMSGRPRKSPVSLIRIGQSPVPGDKSPILFGSPPKQSKHSIPPRLNLIGPKPVIRILPKPAPNALQSSPSPKTPKTITTSPLPIAQSPGSGGRAVHASPVFFREGCFTPSGHGRQINQSPISVSDSSNSSTPGRITQQSPVFFGERPPSSAQSTSQFLQPLSASSISSTSSLATLLRQESPLSVLSNSSGISNASSVFVSNTTNLIISANSNAVNKNNVSDNIVEHSSNVSEKQTSVYSCSPHCSVRENPEDNVLSLEEIEKSASGIEARDDLIDFMDIQALLDLSSDHGGHVAVEHPGASCQSRCDLTCHSMNQTRCSMETLDISHRGEDATDSSSVQEVPTFKASSMSHCENIPTTRSTLTQRGQQLCVSLLTQSLNKLASSNICHNLANTSSTVAQDNCSFGISPPSSHSSGAFRELNNGNFHSSYEGQKDVTFRNTCVVTDESLLQNFRESHTGNSVTAAGVQQFHSQLRELISQERLAESSAVNVSDINNLSNIRKDESQESLEDNNCYLQSEDDIPSCNADASESDLVNLQSSLPLDVLMTSHSICSTSADSVFSHSTHP